MTKIPLYSGVRILLFRASMFFLFFFLNFNMEEFNSFKV